MKHTKFQLKNKLQVILVPSHKSPVVSVQMWVKTGSADERKGEEGISHFIEHLVFKGTTKYKAGEIASTVEASGGELNAYTSFDQTVFYVTISKTFKEVALDVVAQMMGHPTFDETEVNNEREVVCEEIKMGLDSPSRQSSQLLFKSIFKKHAYGIPVIGYEKNVRSWPVKKIREYFQSKYVPSNMYLVVSGDFETAEMKDLVKKYYSDFQSFKFRPTKRVKEPKAKTTTFLSKQKDIKESLYNIAFRAPDVKHKDIAALDVLSMILGQGETSRLFSELRLKSNAVSTVGCYAYSPLDPGLLCVYFKLMEQDPTQAFKGVFSEIEKIRNTKPTWQEIKKAIVILSSEQFYSIETVDGIANKIGSSQFYMKDVKAHEKYLKEIQKMTPEKVHKVAQKYFDIKTASLSLLSPKTEKEGVKILKQGHKEWQLLQKEAQKNKKFVTAIKDKKVKIPQIKFKEIKKEQKAHVERIKTRFGSEIIFYKNSEIPTVSAKIVFGGGARVETQETMGLCELLSRTWLSGTNKKTESEILTLIEGSAAGISPFNGKNTLGVTIEYMSAFESQILNLAEEIILEPLFLDSVITREKAAMLRQIKAKDDQPSYLCGRQFVKHMFGDHPVAYEGLGTEETLKNLNRDMIREKLVQLQNSDNMLTVVVGDFDKAKWIKMIESLEQVFLDRGTVKFKYQQKTDVKPKTQNKKLFLEKDKEQSHVIIGWPGLSINDKDRFVVEAIQAILAGQGGRLFLELRDKLSLAYSVSPIKMESLECGYFGGYIACSPDKVEKSIEMFLKEFDKLVKIEVSNDELDRAKKYLIGQNDIGLQRKSAICNTILFDEFYGNSFEVSLNIAAEYNKITSADVQRVAKKIFTQDYLISVVGKAN